MAFTVNTNIASLQAQNYLRTNSDFQSKTINRVTSGLRIVTSGDDAAGLAIANGFRSDQAVLNQGIRNANDGLSTLQTIDGGMNNISQLLDRARTLATQSASGTFTGDRALLNSEFTSVLGEIDRQAQAVGLNQGGQFAVKLSVFVGGGKASNGTTAIDNGSVSVDLSKSTVDSKSLGLKGVQAMGNSAVDLSAGQASAVDKIVADTVNKGSEAASGYTDFYVSGPGFADGAKVKVSVNLTGVTDADTLVTATNAAITNAGNGTTAAATAFKNAGITANIVTDATGKHLAFSSSTTAFQVGAGDRMSNALLGNITGATTGKSLDTTVTGSAATATLTNTAAAAETIHVRIQGAGMTTPKDLTVSVAQGDLVSSAVDSLTSAVVNDSDLKAAGITVARNAGSGKLVFTSTKGEEFTAMATGDTANLFGLGSFKMGGSLGDQIDYSQITAASNYDRTAATTGGTSVVEFSLNGAASNAATDKVSVDLAGGDATKAKVTGSNGNAGYAFTVADNQLAFAVDGVVKNIALATGGAAATAATATAIGADLTAGVNIHAATAATTGAIGADLTAGVTIDGTNDQLDLTIGGSHHLVSLTQGAAQTGTDVAADINAAFGATVATVLGGKLVLTSTTTGAGASILADQSASNSFAILGLGGVDITATGTNANNQLQMAVDGVSKTVTLTSGAARTATQIAADINGQFAGVAASDTTTVPGEDHLTLTSGTTGAGSHISIMGSSSAAAVLGLGAGVNASGADAGAQVTVATVANSISTAIGGNFTVSVDTTNHISIEANNAGTGHSIQTLAGTANAALGFTEGNMAIGTNRSGADLATALNDAFATKSDLQNAGLSATFTGTQIQITSANDTNFRMNAYTATGTSTAADMVGTKSVAAGGNFNLTGATGLSVTLDGAASPIAVTTLTATMSAQQVVDAINNTTGLAGVASKVTNNGRDFVKLASTTQGAGSSIALTGTSLAVLGLGASSAGSAGDMGFGTIGATFTGNTASAAPATTASVISGGAFRTDPLSFTGISFGGDSQVITVSANDSNGIQRSQDVTLANNATVRNARDIDEAVHAINSDLQKSNIAVLQNIVAMKVDDGGVEKIAFASAGTSGFKVSIGATTNGGGFTAPGTVTAAQEGAGSTAGIGNQASAQKAVDALAVAVTALGSAQAVVGKGQNNFNYAVNLAQSQVTNLAAAESRIRDADLASEAANLSKAQILIQAGTAALAQANSAPQAILSLLRG